MLYLYIIYYFLVKFSIHFLLPKSNLKSNLDSTICTLKSLSSLTYILLLVHQCRTVCESNRDKKSDCYLGQVTETTQPLEAVGSVVLHLELLPLRQELRVLLQSLLQRLVRGQQQAAHFPVNVPCVRQPTARAHTLGPTTPTLRHYMYLINTHMDGIYTC